MNGKTIGFILAALLMLSACRRIQRLDRPYADNPEMQEKVRKSFDLAIALPADMQSSKQGKDFFWLSNNAASGMKNVVIYRIRSCDTAVERGKVLRVARQRDEDKYQRRGRQHARRHGQGLRQRALLPEKQAMPL